MGIPDSCAAVSRRLGESLAGTAILAQRWILLEVDAPWSAKALDTPGIPPKVRAYLASLLAEVPNSRLQLIRRATTGDGDVRLMAVRTSVDGSSHAHSWSLASLEQVCEIDIAAAWQQPATLPVAPFVLVCTHGRRDRCCSKEGYPMFRVLSEQRPEAVWQTTHLGGHRFAATAVVLPLGLQYGRLVPEDAPRLIASMDAATVMDLDRYRGRTGLPRSAQAAEIAIRRDTGELGASALAHVGGELLDDGVRREAFDLGGVHHVRAVAEETEVEKRPFSCGDPPNRSPSVHRVVAAPCP